MERLGILKIIIDLKEDQKSSNYGLLVIDEGERKAYLSYFSHTLGREITSEDLAEDKGRKEQVDQMVKKAQDICEEKEVLLWSY